jgi:hypothetical protein
VALPPEAHWRLTVLYNILTYRKTGQQEKTDPCLLLLGPPGFPVPLSLQMSRYSTVLSSDEKALTSVSSPSHTSVTTELAPRLA